MNVVTGRVFGRRGDRYFDQWCGNFAELHNWADQIMVHVPGEGRLSYSVQMTWKDPTGQIHTETLSGFFVDSAWELHNHFTEADAYPVLARWAGLEAECTELLARKGDKDRSAPDMGSALQELATEEGRRLLELRVKQGARLLRWAGAMNVTFHKKGAHDMDEETRTALLEILRHQEDDGNDSSDDGGGDLYEETSDERVESGEEDGVENSDESTLSDLEMWSPRMVDIASFSPEHPYALFVEHPDLGTLLPIHHYYSDLEAAVRQCRERNLVLVRLADGCRYVAEMDDWTPASMQPNTEDI